MPQPRYTQIDIEATPYYHVISRCVRRAFLCGYDRVTERSFDHRKAWVVEKLAQLAEIFAVHVNAYAVLSNHFHLVLRIDSERARRWSDEEVVERYGGLFPRTVELWRDFPQARKAQRVVQWRARLSDLSWFMRCLNESIARRANDEDGCTGRFWEGRFRSQALLDEAALLTCMSYVDLNPIRAGMARSLEESEFTSIQQRLEEYAREKGEERNGQDPKPAGPRRPELSRFARPGVVDADQALPMSLEEYVELLAATGAAVRAEAPGATMSNESVRLLERFGIESRHWVETVRNYRRHFFSMVGHVHRIAIYCARVDRDRAKGSAWARKVFRPAA
jgi:REP-associated tyrosine transposase